jgi:hypothetical protein
LGFPKRFMKTLPRSLVFTACLAFASPLALAQPVSRVGLPNNANQPEAVLSAQRLVLNWNESFGALTVNVPNESSLPATVYGVQTTGALYVADFPATIPAKGEASFLLLYAARPGAGGATDLLRVITDRAEKVIPVSYEREQAFQLSAATLRWSVGEFSAGKEIVLTMPGAKTAPKSVRAGGEGNKAELRSLGDGRYSVTITPGSTATPRQFPVFIEFEKAVPGVAAVIFCTVSAN